MTWVLTGENLNSAIAWMPSIDSRETQTYETQYVPDFYKQYSCTINKEKRCSIFWKRNNWQIQNSYMIDLDVVTDRRWEGINEIYTDKTTPFRHVQTFSNTIRNKLTINFSIRVPKEAHIFLCDEKDAYEANCYWILLGGLKEVSVAIRKCNYQIPESLSKFPQDPCKTPKQQKRIKPSEFLSINEWKHFSISINKNNIVMKSVSNNVTLINWSDTEENYINISDLIVRSYKVSAYWKFNTYEFTYTTNNSVSKTSEPIGERMNMSNNKLCISFYAAMCAQCSLIISGINITDNAKAEIFRKTIQPLKDNAWQEVKFNMSFPTEIFDIQLYEERHCWNNCHEQFWALDDFRLCTDNEVRVLTVRGNALQSSFQILVSPSRNMNLKPSITPTGDVVQWPPLTTSTGSSPAYYTIGSTNTNCNQIFGHEKGYCEESIICDYPNNEESICRCSPGYTGENCHQKCPFSYYGNGCKEECGYCQFKGCSAFNGNCKAKQDCISNFQGPQCKIPPFPVLTNSPIFINSSDTQIVIQIPNFEYLGLGKPVKYKVKYAKINENNTWYETDSVPIFNKSPLITLSKLSSDTLYTIYVVLLTPEDEFYNGTLSVKMLVANTTCSDIQKGDINVTSINNSSVVLTFRNNPELCPIKNYEIKFLTNDLFVTNDNEFHIPNLAPDTDYNITIMNKNKPEKILYYNFRTKEEAPSAVQSLEIISSNATSLTVSWQQPMKLNGKLKHYIIKLKHHRYLACSENDIIQNIETFLQIQHESTIITLNNLIPFSQYNIEIAGVTVEVGEFSSIMGETEETNTPDEFETPTQVNVKPFSTSAEITLKQANCSLIKGSIKYYITARCENEWCKNRTSYYNTTYYFTQRSFYISGLLAYSMYTMEIKVGRTNGNLYNGELLPTKFETSPAAPNAAEFVIYEESRNIIRLRITPPYPPTGELEQYFIKYCQVYNCNYPTRYCNEKYFEAVTCKIWQKYHCLDISENLTGKKWYRIYVQARNKNITALGPQTQDCEETAQKNAHAPTELNASWDDYYNLTLQWNHPDITNGPLTKFGITILKKDNECNRSDYMVSEESKTYNSVVSINNQDCYTSELTVLIRSFNEKAGSAATLQIYSPPEAPTLNTYVESVSNTTITIALSAEKLQPPELFSKSYMYIVLSESKSKFEIGNFEDALFNLDNLKTLLNAWLITKYNLSTEIPLKRNLTIGSNNNNHLLQSDNGSSEIKLTPNTSYTITILMYNEYQGRKRYQVYEIVNSTSGTTIITNYFINGALFSLILIGLLPLLFWIYIRKRKTGKWCSCVSNTPHMPLAFKARVRGNPDVIPLTKNPSVSTKQIIAPKPPIPSRNASSKSNITKVNDERIINKFSKPIKITDFDKYVKDAITNGELERQHSLFVRGQTKPWDYGALPENKSKNRYNNLIAYDHTRVKLEKIANDPYSDYINANYIDGYKSKKAYIATQGPKVATINDFWRMIWQDNVKYIIMLANIVEGGKKKTEQYWPNINEIREYGNISVKHKSTEVSADYEYRTFVISSNTTERQIEQLHFTSWPDHGVPMYSQSLVPLFRKLLTISQGNSPIVVHCSAGVGRTGTVILCDLCLRMSAHEGVIDVLKHQHKIREQRANLVDNVEQYKLVHLVLLECLINPNTSITCDEEAEKNILRVLETDKLEKQFHFISEIAWQDEAMRTSLEVNQKPEWKLKNRVENITTSGYGRVYLTRYPVTDEHSDYINAVEVDGFKAPNKFIATQQPLPNTISDFWRMIDEKDISTIVSLNSINKENNRSCVFWPTLKISEIQPVPYLLIKFVNKISDEEITIINLQLHNENNKDNPKRDINLIKLKDWPADQLLPNSNVSLLKLWNETEKLSQDTHPIVVTCHDGATSCGLFLAFTFTMEKIKLEHQCDVCLAVRTVRHNREQFVQSLDQFKYLYRAAIAYLNCFELYANFS